jgi:hypothetical protein
MKRLSNVLMAMVMVLGATTAIGCSKPSDKSASDTPEASPVENPTTAPVEDDTATKANTVKPGVENNTVGIKARYYAPFAPPPARFEVRGVAPSHRHFWAPGYWRWSGRQYLWVGGRWELGRPQHIWTGPRYIRTGSRWQYVPGHWVPGHWVKR